jgi:hypothetical protein
MASMAKHLFGFTWTAPTRSTAAADQDPMVPG